LCEPKAEPSCKITPTGRSILHCVKSKTMNTNRLENIATSIAVKCDNVKQRKQALEICKREGFAFGKFVKSVKSGNVLRVFLSGNWSFQHRDLVMAGRLYTFAEFITKYSK
jgi:hypothetical protein